MFDWLLNILDKLWNWIRKIVAIVLVVVAAVLLIYAVFTGLWLYAFYALAALVGAFLIDEDTASEAVGRIGEVIGDVSQALAEIAGEVGGSVLSTLFSSPIGVAVIGLGAYYLLGGFGKDDNNESVDETVDPITETQGDTFI